MIINPVAFIHVTQGHCTGVFIRKYYKRVLTSWEFHSVILAYSLSLPTGEFSLPRLRDLYRGLYGRHVYGSAVEKLIGNVSAAGFYTMDERKRTGRLTEAAYLCVRKYEEWLNTYYGPGGYGPRFLSDNCPIELTRPSKNRKK